MSSVFGCVGWDQRKCLGEKGYNGVPTAVKSTLQFRVPPRGSVDNPNYAIRPVPKTRQYEPRRRTSKSWILRTGSLKKKTLPSQNLSQVAPSSKLQPYLSTLGRPSIIAEPHKRCSCVLSFVYFPFTSFLWPSLQFRPAVPRYFLFPQQLLLSTVENGCPQPRGEYSLQGLCV